ncbi:MAG TPA: hypothetical protein VNA31_00325 [bacterium]|nr:hypothetical protein [bacterium]
MRGVIVGGLVFALIALIAGAAVAQSRTDAAKKQMQTAFFHASELAQKAPTIAGVLQHVQHVVNCLEGSGGKNFNSAPGYPCQGQGSGILPDLQAAADAGDKAAARALRFANVADKLAVNVLKFTEVDAAQPQMKVVANNLQQALDAFK